MPKRDLYAAVDLGSNSFHLVVARQEHGELRVIDQLKDMVRLAGGLDRHGHLDAPTTEQALASLRRFGERIQGIPDDHIRAVGTQTFRRLAQGDVFLNSAEGALCAPIEIIGGREEARLIYRGVCQGMANEDTPKLIIDVGGGSTEVVAGDGHPPTLVESLPMGCVGLTQKYFTDGVITAQRWAQGRQKILADAQSLAAQTQAYPWQQAIGASGTARALVAIHDALYPDTPTGLTRASMNAIRDRLIAAQHSDAIDLPGLSERRRPVIAGGALIVDALMEALGIKHLAASPFALREGLLYDVMARLKTDRTQHNPRHSTIEAMLDRYQCDRIQARRVSHWALAGWQATAKAWSLPAISQELLAAACSVHELGLSIAHEHYHLHSGYILANADMPGFSQTEQQVMATLARGQRGKPDPALLDTLPKRLQNTTLHLLMLMRLAVALSRARNDDRPKHSRWIAKDNALDLVLPNDWLEAHPLTHRDLLVEADQIRRLHCSVRIETMAA